MTNELYKKIPNTSSFFGDRYTVKHDHPSLLIVDIKFDNGYFA